MSSSPQHGATVTRLYDRFFGEQENVEGNSHHEEGDDAFPSTLAPLPAIVKKKPLVVSMDQDGNGEITVDEARDFLQASRSTAFQASHHTPITAVDERRSVGISVHYLASILQPRSVSELGADATIADFVDGIVVPIVSQSLLSPGVPADCALTDTLRGLETVGPPTLVVACPMGCSLFGMVQAVHAWCTRTGRDPRKEFAWMRWASTNLWLPGADLDERVEFLKSDLPDTVSGTSKILLVANPAPETGLATRTARPSKWSTKPQAYEEFVQPLAYTDDVTLYELFLGNEENVPLDVILAPNFERDQRAEVAAHGLGRSFAALEAIQLQETVVAAGLDSVYVAVGGVDLVVAATVQVMRACIVRAAIEVLTALRNRSARFGDQFTTSGWSRIMPIIFSGPPGVGVSTIIDRLFADEPVNFGKAVEHTCKKPAAGERDGEHYHFTSRDVMLTMQADGDLMVRKDTAGQLYATSCAATVKVAKGGRVSVMRTDMLGAEAAKQSKFDPEPIFICLKPPNMQELESRLAKAGFDAKQVKQKLKMARDDLDFIHKEGGDIFDAVLINDEVQKTVDAVLLLAEDSMQKAAVVRQENHSNRIASGAGSSRRAAAQPESYPPDKILESIARLCNQLCPELLHAGSKPVPGLKRTADLARQAALEGIRTNRLIHGDYAHAAVATALLNLGRCLASENTEEILANCKKALSMRLALFGRDSAPVAEVHRVLGGHYSLLMDDTEQALHHWEVSVQILKNIGATWTLAMADSLFEIGREHGKQDNLKAKQSFVKKASLIYAQLYGPAHPVTLRARNVLEATKAMIATLNGDLDRAEEITNRASMLFAEGGRRRTTIATGVAPKVSGWSKLAKKGSVLSILVKMSSGASEDLTAHTRMFCGEQLFHGSCMSTIRGWKAPHSWVVVYFGALATAEFTEMLVTMYESANKSTRTMDVVYVGCDADKADHDEHIAMMPWASIPFEDKVRNLALRKRYSVRELPFLPLLAPDASVGIKNARYNLEECIEKNNLLFPWYELSYKKAIGAKLVKNDGTDRVDAIKELDATTIHNKVVGVYFPPAGKPVPFAQTLLGVYNQVGLRPKAEGIAEFEILHTPAPGSTKEQYMDVLASVPWLGMQYDIGAANKLSAKLGVYSRPALVIMSQTGAVINRNARAVIEEDTLGYSFPWTPHIVQTLDKMDDLNSSTVLVILADGCRLDQVATLTDRLDCLGKDWAYRARSNGEEPSYMFALARPGDQLAPAVRKTCGLPDLPELAPTAVILDMRDDRAYYLGEDGVCASEGTLSSFLAMFERGVLKRYEVKA